MTLHRIAFLLAACWAPVASAQLRIVTYNTNEGPRSGMSTILQAIGAESINGVARPIDVLALQEQEYVTTTTQAIVNVLNNIYGAGTYARSTLNVDTSGSGRPTLIYNTQTVELLGEAAIGSVSSSGGARQTARYQLRPVGYDSGADFYMYVSHFKSSDDSTSRNRRNEEAIDIRQNADALGAGKSIIYAGDLNLYTSSEPAYQTLLSSGNGQAFDPVSRSGSWSDNSSFRDVHTQSPTTTSHFGGQVTGGMDDRFDFQLISSALKDGEGLSYIGTGIPNLHISPSRHSYHAFGNNGTHSLNGDITSGTGAASNVLTALTANSDHLPVVADYQLPARMSVSSLSGPSRVMKGSSASASFTVTNSADVAVAIGADELNYTWAGSGSASGSGSGIDNPTGLGNGHSVSLSTATTGAKSATVLVSATSAQVPTAEASASRQLS